MRRTKRINRVVQETETSHDSLRHLGRVPEMHRVVADISKCVVALRALERRRRILSCTLSTPPHRRPIRDKTYNHFINEDAQCPPIYRSRVSLRSDDLWRNVLCAHPLALVHRPQGTTCLPCRQTSWCGSWPYMTSCPQVGPAGNPAVSQQFAPHAPAPRTHPVGFRLDHDGHAPWVA